MCLVELLSDRRQAVREHGIDQDAAADHSGVRAGHSARQMADLIRKVTIQKGFDPRDFALFAFGGAGPVHAAVFARELGIDRVVIPQGETASVWCAFGAVASDILHVDERVEITRAPFDPARISALLAELRARGAAQLERDGVTRERQRFALSVDMRHRGQINEVEVELAC